MDLRKIWHTIKRYYLNHIYNPWRTALLNLVFLSLVRSFISSHIGIYTVDKNTKRVTDWVIILLLGFLPEIIHVLQNASNSEHTPLSAVSCRIIAAHDKARGSISLQPRLRKPCAACYNGALPYEYDHRISVSLAHQSLLALVGESDNLQEIPLNLNSAGWIKKYPWAECLRRMAALPLFFPETSYNTINLVQEEKYGT